MEKRLTARVSSELHRRVRQAALSAGDTVDRFIEDALLNKLQPSEEKTKGSDTLVNVSSELPESFLQDCVAIYRESLDTWYALVRIVSAIARKKAKREAHRDSKFEPAQPFPGEAKDKKDNTG